VLKQELKAYRGKGDKPVSGYHQVSCAYCQSTKSKASGNQEVKIEVPRATETKDNGAKDNITSSDGASDGLVKCLEKSVANPAAVSDGATNALSGGSKNTPRRVLLPLNDPSYLFSSSRNGPFAIRRY